ncbi:MAG TPA: hypothetical protein VFV68_13825, partial [Agriterribacter sp.]|nr:hypothetical protein [Agriterribacter sp.]
MYNSYNSKHFLRQAMLVFSFSIFSSVGLGQVYSDKAVGKKNAEVKDSLQKSDYPYSLPIWGEKVAKLGFNLPYSAGIGINYLWQKSDLEI